MTRIILLKGDITTQKVDAIVNSANRTLRGGGGLDWAIHEGAGPELGDECDALGGCEAGEAKITKGYSLPAKYIIHTVGPDYGYEKGKDAELLRSCYVNSLNLAKENGIKTIAFPAISVGIFHYPLKEATNIAIESVKEFVARDPEVFHEVRFIAFSDDVYDVYSSYIHTYWTKINRRYFENKNMIISEKHLNEFKVLLKDKMGEEKFNKLSEQDILESATKLLTLVKIVYKPMTQKEFDLIHENVKTKTA